MKIVQAEAIPLHIPFKRPFRIAVGTLTHTNHILVKMTDEAGRTGYGECTTFLAVYGYDQKSLYHMLTDHLIPAVVGLEISDLARIHRQMDRVTPGNLMAKAGIDLAVHDLLAQAADKPIHGIIGGSRMDRVPLICTIGLMPPDQAVETARELVARGFSTVKVKIGTDPGRDIARVRAIRETFGDEIRVRVDGNCGYDRATALEVFTRMEAFQLEWIEQPLAGWDLEGMAALSESLDTPVAVDESMYTAQDALRCITMKAADVVNIKLVKCGGIYRSQKIAALCAAAGIPCFLGGCVETMPGTSAAAHFYAATDNMVSAAEIYGASRYTDDIVTRHLDIVDGSVMVPATPGLGVEIDPEKLEKYRCTY